jgi:hypothetical protein
MVGGADFDAVSRRFLVEEEHLPTPSWRPVNGRTEPVPTPLRLRMCQSVYFVRRAPKTQNNRDVRLARDFSTAANASAETVEVDFGAGNLTGLATYGDLAV